MIAATPDPGQIASPELRSAARRFGQTWLLLAAALALHVTDEALTDFLSVYNPVAEAIRHRVPWLPLPVFSFAVWIMGLALGIALLLALSPLAFRATRWLVAVAIPFSALMVMNGLGHVGGSVYLGRFMPGVYSSPILIAAAAMALIGAVRVFRLRNPRA